MEELRELVKIVTNRGQKKIALLEWDDDKRLSKDMELFYGIQKAEYTTDQQAAASLYGGTPDQASYKMAKSRLRKKLLNHLFFLDFNNRSKISHKFEQECLNLLHQARMLINLGEYKTSERLLNKLLKISFEAEFTYITVSSLELLLMIYAQVGKSYLFYKNKEVLIHYRNILKFEQEAEDYYNTARLELSKSVQARKEFLPKLVPLLERLKKLWKQSYSFNNFHYYYKLKIFLYDMVGQPAEIIAVTIESDQLFEQGKINAMRFDHRFNKFMNVHAYLRSKDYKKGLLLAGEYIHSFDQSSNNWFAFMENYFLLALHAREYTLALQLITQATQNPFFSKISRMAKERWSLYRSYLYFVNPSESLYTDFTYQTLINSVPEYSKDKQGFNVAILILQYLYFLKKRDLESLLHRIEAMRKYAGTHLRDNFSDRAKALFKLLMIPVKEDFKPMYCRKKGKYLYEKLQVISPPGEAYAEIEIIPYEHIWEMILDILSNSKHVLQKSYQ
jgi:hypothetical protein